MLNFNQPQLDKLKEYPNTVMLYESRHEGLGGKSLYIIPEDVRYPAQCTQFDVLVYVPLRREAEAKEIIKKHNHGKELEL